LGEYNLNKNDQAQSDGTLLNKIDLEKEDISCKISFDLTIKTKEGISFKSNIVLDLPTADISKTGVDIKDLTEDMDIIFKRV
jgi:hypothetical protein